MDCIEAQPCVQILPSSFRPTGATGISSASSESSTVFAGRAKLEAVTPHVLRHTFASVAGDLGFSELTIAGLLGHSAHGVTQRYVHLDTALVVAADRVSTEIAKMLGCEAPTERSGNRSCEHVVLRSAVAAPQSPEEFDFSSLRIDFSHKQN